jgi:hypothetical protein
MRRRTIVASLAELLPAQTDPWARELAFVVRAADRPQPAPVPHLRLVPPPAEAGPSSAHARRRKALLKTVTTPA